MITYEILKAGCSKYLDMELMPKIPGWRKWAVGAALAMYLEKGIDVFNALKENDFIKALDVINKDNEIDLEKLYKAILAQAEKSAVTFKTNILGDITIKADDVKKLYCYIKEFER